MTGNDSAVLVQRVAPQSNPDVSEITSLSKSAGYTVESVCTQSRYEDAEYHIGKGKVSEIHHEVEETGSKCVIFDNVLTPRQKYNLGLYFPTNVKVLDRYTLILNIFEKRASTRKSQLQVELAKLRYELPRYEVKKHLAKKEEKPGFMGLGEYDENRKEDIYRRIHRIHTELQKQEKTNEQRREQRREKGYSLVSIAGYTNAGKSTLLQRLSDELEVGQNSSLHPDLSPTAEVTSDLFTTLDTTTRRMEHEKRDILLTDTIGFISDIPHWLVESFESTLSSVYQSDIVLLVVDASDSQQEIHEKLVGCHDILAHRNEASIVTVLNKCDLVSDAELSGKINSIKPLAPNPICVSAETGENIDSLKDRIESELPDLRSEKIKLPMSNNSMSLVSEIHDETNVQNTEYKSDNIVMDVEGTTMAVEKILNQVGDLSHS